MVGAVIFSAICSFLVRAMMRQRRDKDAADRLKRVEAEIAAAGFPAER